MGHRFKREDWDTWDSVFRGEYIRQGSDEERFHSKWEDQTRVERGDQTQVNQGDQTHFELEDQTGRYTDWERILSRMSLGGYRSADFYDSGLGLPLDAPDPFPNFSEDLNYEKNDLLAEVEELIQSDKLPTSVSSPGLGGGTVMDWIPSSVLQEDDAEEEGEEEFDVTVLSSSEEEDDEEDEEKDEDEEVQEAEEVNQPEQASTITIPEGMRLRSDWSSLSEYEKTREINKFKNEQMLASLGIQEGGLLGDKKGKEKKARKRRVAEEDAVPVRSSTRERRQIQSYNEDDATRSRIPTVVRPTRERKQRQPYNEDAAFLLQAAGSVEDDVAAEVVAAMERRGRKRGRPKEGEEGDVWEDPPPKAQSTRMLKRDRFVLSEEYPDLWFGVKGVPTSGNLGLVSTDFPPLVFEMFKEHIAFLDTGKRETLYGTNQKEYKGVKPQSSKVMDPFFIGWQVQLFHPDLGKPIRLGLTDDSLVGALMIVLADMYPVLFNNRNMYMFLYLLAAQGEPILDRFVREVGDAVHQVNPAGRSFKGGRPPSTSTKRGNARETHLVDSFMNDSSAMLRKEEERKASIRAEAESAIEKAKQFVVPYPSSLSQNEPLEPLPALDDPEEDALIGEEYL